jgi:hypothetical protein
VDPAYVYVANLDVEEPSSYFAVPQAPDLALHRELICDFSTTGDIAARDQRPTFNGKHYRVEGLAPGEGRAYRVG